MFEVSLPDIPQSPSSKIELFEEFDLGPHSGCIDCQVIVENNEDLDFNDLGHLELCDECESAFTEVYNDALDANSAEQCCDKFIDHEPIKQPGLQGELAKTHWWKDRVLKTVIRSIRNTIGESHDWIEEDDPAEA